MPLAPTGTAKRRRIIMLAFTERCNLNCVYCYEHNKKVDVMPLSVAQDAITRFMASPGNYNEVEIDFHGGEPFTEFDFIQYRYLLRGIQPVIRKPVSLCGFQKAGFIVIPQHAY